MPLTLVILAEPQRRISCVSGEIIALHRLTWPAEQDDTFVTARVRSYQSIGHSAVATDQQLTSRSSRVGCTIVIHGEGNPHLTERIFTSLAAQSKGQMCAIQTMACVRADRE
jgi:hypothetical protein